MTSSRRWSIKSTPSPHVGARQVFAARAVHVAPFFASRKGPALPADRSIADMIAICSEAEAGLRGPVADAHPGIRFEDLLDVRPVEWVATPSGVITRDAAASIDAVLLEAAKGNPDEPAAGRVKKGDAERRAAAGNPVTKTLLQALFTRNPAPCPDSKHLLRLIDTLGSLIGSGHAKALELLVPELAAMQSVERATPVLGRLDEILTDIPPGIAGPTGVATLGTQLIGRGKTFAERAGRDALVVLLQSARSPAEFSFFAQHGPRTLRQLLALEPGPSRESLNEHFAADLSTVHTRNIDLAQIRRDCCPPIPGEIVARVVAIAVEEKIDVNEWLSTVATLFHEVRGVRDLERELRALIVLAHDAGAEVVGFCKTLSQLPLKQKAQSRIVAAVLSQTYNRIEPANLAEATAMLQRGEDVVERIAGGLRESARENLGLDARAFNGDKVTARGRAALEDPVVQQFFALGNQAQAGYKPFYEGMAQAILEERFSEYRFTTPVAAVALRSLSADQRRAWEKTEGMSHLRFEGDGKVQFTKRVTTAANTGRALHTLWTEEWGTVQTIDAQVARLTERLRGLDKNDIAARTGPGREMRDLVQRKALMQWAQKLMGLNPEHVTPFAFQEMANGLEGRRAALGDETHSMLRRLLRVDDLNFYEVTTHDGPNLQTMFTLGNSNCLRWPGSTPVLGYMVDPNKRMIITRTAGGELRRSILRLVEQTGENDGKPMLVLERTYPDSAGEEEKRRVMEHALRRAVELGVPIAYPTEYYAKPQGTARAALIRSLEAEIEDLKRKYPVDSQMEVVVSVRNAVSNVAQEYIDSAPTGGAAQAGVPQSRLYNGQAEVIYNNKFTVLTPKAG